MPHLLALRFSALGDVLMTVPVISQLARQYPDLTITVVSRPLTQSIFAQLPPNVHFHAVKPQLYPGLPGLVRMWRELRGLRPTVVCDLHDVLRTKVLRLLARLSGLPVTHIRKDRRARRRFLSERPVRQQVTAIARYQAALAELGYPVDMTDAAPLFTSDRKQGIGIAPFAAHRGKTYPAELMEEVVRLLAEDGHRICIFGAGDGERKVAEGWAERYPGVESLIGRLPDMAAEAHCIAGLQVMLAMDSGNMHLAALTDTPVVSLWGATHPLGGFLGWRQPMANVLQAGDLACRPCSIFGNKPCRQGNYPCLRRITPEAVRDKIRSIVCS